MPFSSWLFRCTTIQFPATPLRCFSMHIHCCSNWLFSLTSLFNAIRIATTHFQYDAVLSNSIAFHSHSLALLLRAVPFLRISILFFSIASPLPTILALIRSARFHSNSVQRFSVPTHYISRLFLCFSNRLFSLTSLFNALAFRFQTCPYCSCAYQLGTFPFLHTSELCPYPAIQCLRITFLCQA